MPKSVNKVILVGHLGKDPEVKYTTSGTAVASFSMATAERFKDQSGNWQDRTEWHNVILWARLAEVAGEYLKKGRMVYVEGRLQTRSWDDKQTGEKKYRTEVIGSDIVLLGGDGEQRDNHQQPQQQQRRGGYRPQQTQQRNQREEQQQTEYQATDEDIPF